MIKDCDGGGVHPSNAIHISVADQVDLWFILKNETLPKELANSAKCLLFLQFCDRYGGMPAISSTFPNHNPIDFNVT